MLAQAIDVWFGQSRSSTIIHAVPKDSMPVSMCGVRCADTWSPLSKLEVTCVRCWEIMEGLVA